MNFLFNTIGSTVIIIQSSGDLPTTAILAENGDFLLTENGDYLVME